jgi:signal peptidase I
MGFVMRPTVVSGASMMPTLHDKDVLINRRLPNDCSNRLVAILSPFAFLQIPFVDLFFQGVHNT